jgi:hypothetical protein
MGRNSGKKTSAQIQKVLCLLLTPKIIHLVRLSLYYSRPNLYWTVTWGLVAPLVMAIIFLFYCFQWEPVKYGTVGYPNWAHVIGKLPRKYC